MENIKNTKALYEYAKNKAIQLVVIMKNVITLLARKILTRIVWEIIGEFIIYLLIKLCEHYLQS